MVEKEVDLIFVEERVENLNFVERIVVVVEMAMIIVDFDLELGLADFEKMEDIGKIEQISHKGSAYLASMLEKHCRVSHKITGETMFHPTYETSNTNESPPKSTSHP